MKHTKTFFGKRELSKSNLLIQACGVLDELNSFVGLARSGLKRDKDLDKALEKIQLDLFKIGSELFQPAVKRISSQSVEFLENFTRNLEKKLPKLKKFILPAGSEEACLLHVCRTVCRRVESVFALLAQRKKINPNTLAYLNRLSTFFFACARTLNKRKKVKEKEVSS